MCTNSRIIYNKAVDFIRVDCGHCPSCQQVKAQRLTQRIRDTRVDGLIPLFVTLTYAPAYLPYIRSDEMAERLPSLNIYRDASCRYVRVSTHRNKYGLSLHRKFETVVLDTVSVDYLSRGAFSQYDLSPIFSNMRSAEGSPGYCYGVIYYKDLQDFFKRLKQDLIRNYGYDTSKDYISFQCAEYGPGTFRPHFHFLLWCPSCFETAVRRSICKNWPFADRNRTKNYIEIARNAASYVSSYCNRPSDFPPFLAQRPFRPRHSFSKVLGFNNDDFSFHSIVSKIQRGNFEVSREIVDECGCKSIVAVSLPKYVINRYFPKIKGFAILSANTDFNGFELIARHPQRFVPIFKDWLNYRDYRSELSLPDDDILYGTDCLVTPDGQLLELGEIYTLDGADTFLTCEYIRHNIPVIIHEDLRQNFVALFNAWKRCQSQCDYVLTYREYLFLYWQAWHVWNMTQLRLWYSHQRDFASIAESYEYPEQLSDDYLKSHGFNSAILRNMILSLPRDVNKHPKRIQQTIDKQIQFEKKVKQRKVTNFVMASNHHYV